MKKRIIGILSLFLVFAVCISDAGLFVKAANTTVATNYVPNQEQIQNICNLATYKCFYHNVAKATKAPGEGIFHIGEKERKFWIEYTGIATIGIDTSKIKVIPNENNYTISIPKAELLNTTIENDSLTEDSYVSSENGINPNNITAEEQNATINTAQEAMKTAIQNNQKLLYTAQIRARDIIQSYFIQINEMTHSNYTFSFILE